MSIINVIQIYTLSLEILSIWRFRRFGRYSLRESLHP